MRKRVIALTFFLCCFAVAAQEYFPKNDGVKSQNTNYTALTNAKIYITPTQVIESGTLLIQDGKVVASGTSVNIPENSVVIDLKGKYIYPSFIDIYSNFGVEKPKRSPGGGFFSAQYKPSREGFYWNDHIMPDSKAIDKFKFSNKKAKELLTSGFGVVNTHIQDGIIRGTSVLVALNTKADNSARILDQNAAQHLSFSKSVVSKQSYPTSIMGAMALLRQFYYDAKWYAAGGNTKTKDMAIEALLGNRNLPQIFEANDKLNDLRADKIATEFNLNYIIKGGGNEFERISEIAATKASYIIPVNFPAAYDVTDPYQASKVTLGEMRMWNQAPVNLKMLAENGVRFALTTDGLKKLSAFKSNIMRAITYGFDATKALEALTTIPAQLMGKSNEIGSLRNGTYANFLITSGPVFDKKTILYENWVQGEKYLIKDMNIKDIRGAYTLKVSGNTLTLKISGKLEQLKSDLKIDTTKISSKITYKNGWVHLFYNPLNGGKTEFVRLAAAVTSEGDLSGVGTLANGTETSWTAIKSNDASKKGTKTSKKADSPKLQPITYPNKAYGFTTMPKQQTILFKDATVWTGEAAGILKNTDILVKNGKISAIGQNLSAGNATIIDASGKHVTAGIIDEHSHIAASSINEAGHNSSAEVTIEDVVDSEDSNIYRNLSGGVTTIQILHGSANPIGGRSAIIKLKWGESPEGLLLKNRPKFIKFALGENVKQSNWGNAGGNRFPQTRMGVEQVFVDYFQQAKAYDTEWKKYNALSQRQKARAKAPRYDIEMETLAEILNKKRFISCHSYVQSEINMLMKVAEQFNFKVNTFTHILEGYKVADKMAKHGAGGSTFSDWWAYKYEVNDAIPYNAAIMNSQGVTVAINSDDGEMSRRLNQEAAKTIKYGGMSEEEAWKTVTLNPAKLLHIDKRTGSIKEGKDADLVLWSDHPMSIYAIAEKTMIEGTIYYDYEQMQHMQSQIHKERNDLISKMIHAKNSGVKTQVPKKKEAPHFHCDTLIYQN